VGYFLGSLLVFLLAFLVFYPRARISFWFARSCISSCTLDSPELLLLTPSSKGGDVSKSESALRLVRSSSLFWKNVCVILRGQIIRWWSETENAVE